MGDKVQGGKSRYRLILVGFHSRTSLRRTARFLSRVFRERSEAEIVSSLERLPVLLATRLELSEAETLRRHLQWHGAHVRMVQDNCSSSARSDCVSRTEAASTTPELGTTYRKSRPGFKDTVRVSPTARATDYSR